jgi:transposase-like protein
MYKHPDLTPLLARKLEELFRTRALNEAQAIAAARLLVRAEPDDQVAHRFGVSASALYAALRHYKIPTPTELRLRRKRFQAAIVAARSRGCYVPSTAKLTQAQAIEVARRSTSGKSILSIARFFGVRPMTLRAALRRHGLLPPSRKLIEHQVVAAARRIAKGETLATVARALGVWPVTLGCALRRYRLSTAEAHHPQRRN